MSDRAASENLNLDVRHLRFEPIQSRIALPNIRPNKAPNLSPTQRGRPEQLNAKKMGVPDASSLCSLADREPEIHLVIFLSFSVNGQKLPSQNAVHNPIELQFAGSISRRNLLNMRKVSIGS